MHGDSENRPRTAAWTWGIATLAVLFAAFGIWTGVRQMPGPDDGVETKNAGEGRPGNAMSSDTSLEDVRRRTLSSYVPHVHGEPPDTEDNLKCPGYQSVTSKLTTTVSAGTSLMIESDLHLVLTGVIPPNPPLRDKLQRPQGAREFASCFIATDTYIKSINWADGKLVADLALERNPITGYTNQIVYFRSDDSALVIDLCKPLPEWATGERSICKIGVDSTVEVRVVKPVENLISVPFPANQVADGDTVTATWEFEGPMPPLTLMLGMPDVTKATSWLASAQGRNFAVPFSGGRLSADLYYLTDTAAIFLAFIVAAVLLGRDGSAPPRLARRRLLLFALAVFVLGFQLQNLGGLSASDTSHAPDISNGVIVVVAWALLALALAGRTLVSTTIVLSQIALATLCFLAITPQRELVTTVYLAIFCVSLVGLVGVAGWALWGQVATLFSMVKLDGDTPVWRDLYRRILYCCILAAFMYAIGFPIGEALRFIEHTDDSVEIKVIAYNLIWSTGLSFRYLLVWVGLLIVVSFLIAHLLRMPRNVLGATAAVELALVLSLSAPWINQIAIGIGTSLPVWLVQFAILLVAFRVLISGAVREPVTRKLNPRKQSLLVSARATVPKEKPKPPAHGGGRLLRLVRGAGPSTRVYPMAGPRLLMLGSQKGRLPNAKASAQIAGVIAIGPVGYLVWTTLDQLPEQLSTNTGIMVVVLFAVLEFVRWAVIGFVFGYLYSKLPGQIGPVKALVFALIWIASCVGPLVVAQASGRNLTQETIYRSAQFALFVIILAVVFDLKTVKAAGGTWRDLRSVYDLSSYAEVVAAFAPAALLAVTLAQQIASGSGFEVANSLLSGITGVLKGPS